MEIQLNMDPAHALELIHSFQGNIVKKVITNISNADGAAEKMNSVLSPSAIGIFARRIPEYAEPLNYQIRFINLLI